MADPFSNASPLPVCLRHFFPNERRRSADKTGCRPTYLLTCLLPIYARRQSRTSSSPVAPTQPSDHLPISPCSRPTPLIKWRPSAPCPARAFVPQHPELLSRLRSLLGPWAPRQPFAMPLRHPTRAPSMATARAAAFPTLQSTGPSAASRATRSSRTLLSE